MENLDISTKKMSLANMENSLSLSEMENVMAGSRGDQRVWCITSGVLVVLAAPWGGPAAPLIVAGGAAQILSC